MKKTTKYHFNLIEKDDTFSPDPLNENAKTAEAALNGFSSTGQELTNRITNLDSRVVVLEQPRVAVGVYCGTGTDPQTIHLGFRPIAIALFFNSPAYAQIIYPAMGNSGFTFLDDGFQVYGGMNNAEIIRHYLAVA